MISKLEVSHLNMISKLTVGDLNMSSKLKVGDHHISSDLWSLTSVFIILSKHDLQAQDGWSSSVISSNLWSLIHMSANSVHLLNKYCFKKPERLLLTIYLNLNIASKLKISAYHFIWTSLSWSLVVIIL